MGDKLGGQMPGGPGLRADHIWFMRRCMRAGNLGILHIGFMLTN